MGISSKKTKSKTTPVYSRQIEGAHSTLSNAYNANAPRVQQTADQLSGLVPGMIDKYKAGDAGVNAARDYNVDVLGGKYLDAGNPYLDDMISQTNDSVRNQLGASLAKMGLGPAGTSYQGLVGRKLAENELGLRYGDYNAERDRMANAAGQSAGLAAADAIGIAPLLSTAQLGANLPMDNALRYAAGTGGLLGQYTNTTQKSKGSLLDSIGQIAQIGAIAFSDARLKEDVRRIGATDAGLPVYSFRYKGDDAVRVGVMAQDVAVMQPEALGPVLGGYQTVNYAEVR